MNMGKLLPNSSEILFLKRLLYLKASIDNESTINAYSVPFQEEKARDQADKDQLQFDTKNVGSARHSSDYTAAQTVLGG